MLFFFYLQPMPDRVKKQKFAFLAILMLAVFSYPLISIANSVKLIGGIPVLYVYIFISWLISIVLLFRTSEKKDRKKSSDA